MKIKNVKSTVAILLILILALSGCKSNEVSMSSKVDDGDVSESVDSVKEDVEEVVSEEVSVISLYHHVGEQAKRDAIQAWADGATALNPLFEYEINAVSDPTQYKNLIKTKIAAGDPPDIMFGTPRDHMELIEAGHVMDVTAEAYMGNYTDEILSGVTVDGKIYGIPIDLGLLLVYYNKDIFNENNIDIPVTYGEYIEVCETLSSNGINPLSYGFKDAWTAGVDFMFEWYMMLDKVPDMFKEIEETEKTFGDFPLFRRGMERTRERVAFSTNNPFGTDNNQSVQLFASGQAAMFESGTWNISTIRGLNPDGNFGMFLLPADAEEDSVARLFLDDTFMISNSTTNSEGVQLFFDYALSDEGANIWAGKTGLIPAIKGVQLTDVDPMTADALAIKESGKTIFADIQHNPTGQLFDLFFGRFSSNFIADNNKSIDEFIDELTIEYKKAVNN